MNVWKKVGALTFVMVLALVLSVSAFAEETSNRGKVNNPSAEGTPVEWAYNGDALTDVSFDVTVSATEGTPVPGTQFTYTITSKDIAPADLVLFDIGSNATAASTTVTFATHTATSAGETRSVTLKFDDTKATARPAQGYYRYAITASGGNTRFSNTTQSLDLIVYINNKTEVYAAILVPTGTTPEKNDENGSNKDVYAGKVQGFTHVYTGYNVTISNNSAGNTVANDTPISFDVKLVPPFEANTFVTSALPVEYSVGNGSRESFFGASNASFDATNGATAEVSIPIGSAMTLYGLPDGTQVFVKEKEGDSYQITSTVSDMSDSGQIGATQEYKEAVEFITKGTIQTKAGSIVYNNERANISPTGVVLRYAPYLLTLGAGITILPLSRRYKKREED